MRAGSVFVVERKYIGIYCLQFEPLMPFGRLMDVVVGDTIDFRLRWNSDRSISLHGLTAWGLNFVNASNFQSNIYPVLARNSLEREYDQIMYNFVVRWLCDVVIPCCGLQWSLQFNNITKLWYNPFLSKSKYYFTVCAPGEKFRLIFSCI